MFLTYCSARSDVIGVVQTVSPSMSIRRKSNNESIPKRDITIADETYLHNPCHLYLIHFHGMLVLLSALLCILQGKDSCGLFVE